MPVANGRHADGSEPAVFEAVPQFVIHELLWAMLVELSIFRVQLNNFKKHSAAIIQFGLWNLQVVEHQQIYVVAGVVRTHE